MEHHEPNLKKIKIKTTNNINVLKIASRLIHNTVVLRTSATKAHLQWVMELVAPFPSPVSWNLLWPGMRREGKAKK